MKEKIILDSGSIDKTLNRLSHEIYENSKEFDQIVLIGIHNRGVPLSRRLKDKVEKISGSRYENGAIDISFHRDDYRERLFDFFKSTRLFV